MKIDRAYPVKDHRVGLHEGSYQGVIKVGDTVVTTSWGNDARTGIIKTIRVAMDDHDVAAENDTGVDVNSYNTKLEYQGSITYGDGYWCYFNQIIRKE